MQQNITTELLSVIYKRAMQYCMVAFGGKDGKEPDELRLQEDGTFCAVWVPYYATCISEWEFEYFSIDKLTEDLEQVYNERKARESEMERQRELERERKKKQEQEMEKRNRYSQYLNLKKEFE